MANKATKPILLVKKADSKKGSLWNTLTNRRIIKQHGGFDIPEGDLHAIHKFESPLHSPATTPEEAKTALSDLEKEIQDLKQKDKQNVIPEPSTPPDDFDEFLREGGQEIKADDDEE